MQQVHVMLNYDNQDQDKLYEYSVCLHVGIQHLFCRDMHEMLLFASLSLETIRITFIFDSTRLKNI